MRIRIRRLIVGFLVHSNSAVVYIFNRTLNFIQLSFGYDKNGPLDELSIVFINLDKREDRLKSITSEFKRLRIYNYKRFSAIQNQNGALGCSSSHESVLLKYSERSKLLMICEDDVLFMHTRGKLNRTLKDFQKIEEAAVMCLGFNTQVPKQKIFKQINRIKESQTTSCYVVKPEYVGILLENASESKRQLMKNPDNSDFQLDQMWKNLQQKYIFVAPSRRAAIQRPSYSDIQLKSVRYGV